MYNKILLPDDGSPLGREAIPHVIALASAGRGGVLVLRVSHAAGEDPHALGSDTWFTLVRSGADAVAAAGEHVEADPPLLDVVAMLVQAGIAAVGTLVVKSDDPGAAIVEVSDRLGCDLVVMSTHGLSGVRRALLGSVSDHVSRHSRVPVLLCR
jgi:nucleotide-binding universal stress UspA family protein